VQKPEETKAQVLSKVDDNVSIAADANSAQEPPTSQKSWWNGLNLWTNDKPSGPSDGSLAESSLGNGSKQDPKTMPSSKT
jgi:hypothetical protein